MTEYLETVLVENFSDIFKQKGVQLNLDKVNVLEVSKRVQKFELYNEEDKRFKILVTFELGIGGEVNETLFELKQENRVVFEDSDFDKFVDKVKEYVKDNVLGDDEWYTNIVSNMKPVITEIHQELEGYNPDGEVYFNEEKSSKEDLKLVYSVGVKGSKLGLKCELLVLIDKGSLEVVGLEGMLVNEQGLNKKVSDFQKVWVEASKELEGEVPLDEAVITNLRIEKLEEWLNKNSNKMGHEINWDEIRYVENTPKKAIYDVRFKNEYNIDLGVTVTVKYLSSKVDVYDDNVEVVIDNNKGIFKEKVNFESMFGIIKDLKDYDERVLDKFRNDVTSNENALDNLSFKYVSGDEEDSLNGFNENKLNFVMDIEGSEQGLKVVYSQGVRLSKHDDRVLLEEDGYILTDASMSFKEDVTLNSMWDKIYEKEPSLKEIDSSLESSRLTSVSEYFKGLLGDEIPIFEDIYSFDGGADEDSYQIDFPSKTFKDGLNLSVVGEVEFKKDSSEIKSFTNIVVHNGGDDGFEETEVSKTGLSKLLKDYLNVKEEYLTAEDIKRLKGSLDYYIKKSPGAVGGYKVDFIGISEIKEEKVAIFDITMLEGKVNASVNATVHLTEDKNLKSVDLYLIFEREDGTSVEKNLSRNECWREVKKLLFKEGILLDGQITYFKEFIDKYHEELPHYIENNTSEFSELNKERVEIIYRMDIKGSKRGLYIESGIMVDIKGFSIRRVDLYIYDKDLTINEQVKKEDCWRRILEIEPELGGDGSLSQEKIEKYERAITNWHSYLPGYLLDNVAEFTDYDAETKELVLNTSVKNSKKGVNIITTVTLDDVGKFKKIELYLLDDEELDMPVHKDKCWLLVRKADPSVEGDGYSFKNKKKEYAVVLKENNSKQSLERLKRMHLGYRLSKGVVKSEAINHDAFGQVITVKSGNLNYLLSYGIIVDLNDERVVYDFRKEEDIEKVIAKELKIKQYQGEDNNNFYFIFTVYLRCRDLRRNNKDYLVELANKLYNK